MRIESARHVWSGCARVVRLLGLRHGGGRWPREFARTGFAIAVIFAYEWFQWW
jgi:hypothetical protein